MESGEAAEFKGNPLNEIDVDLEEDLMQMNNNNESDHEEAAPNPSVKNNSYEENARNV